MEIGLETDVGKKKVGRCMGDLAPAMILSVRGAVDIQRRKNTYTGGSVGFSNIFWSEVLTRVQRLP